MKQPSPAAIGSQQNITAKKRIAVLVSGGGSNLQAILEHFSSLGDSANGEVVLVLSNKAEVYGLARAERVGIPNAVIDCRASHQILQNLAEHNVDVIVLAGYLRLIPAEVVEAYRGRIINIHPGPIPDFGGAGMYGLRVHEAVIKAGRQFTEITIHFVDEIYDRGAIIATFPIPVLEGDDAESLANRVLGAEHVVYPRVIDALCGVLRLPISSQVAHK